LHKEKSQVIQIAAHSNCPRPFTMAQSFNFTGNFLYSKNKHRQIFHFFADMDRLGNRSGIGFIEYERFDEWNGLKFHVYANLSYFGKSTNYPESNLVQINRQ
jgi:hypothetical protein